MSLYCPADYVFLDTHRYTGVQNRRIFFTIVNCMVLGNTIQFDNGKCFYYCRLYGIGGILCVWRGGIGKYYLNSEKLGFNMDRGPQARGPYWTPISKNEDSISQYLQARRTVLTLLSIWLKPKHKINQKQEKTLYMASITCPPPGIVQYQGGTCYWSHIWCFSPFLIDFMSSL